MKYAVLNQTIDGSGSKCYCLGVQEQEELGQSFHLLKFLAKSYKYWEASEYLRSEYSCEREM